MLAWGLYSITCVRSTMQYYCTQVALVVKITVILYASGFCTWNIGSNAAHFDQRKRCIIKWNTVLADLKNKNSNGNSIEPNAKTGAVAPRINMIKSIPNWVRFPQRRFFCLRFKSFTAEYLLTLLGFGLQLCLPSFNHTKKHALFLLMTPPGCAMARSWEAPLTHKLTPCADSQSAG